MKKNLKICLSVLIFGLLASNLLLAQSQSEYPTAWLTDDLSITLDTDSPVSTIYVADVSHYSANMADQQKADAFIKYFEHPNVTFNVDLQSYKLTITLEKNAENENWTVERWNEYLKSN